MAKEMTERSEYLRLNRVYGKLPPNRKAIAQGLITQAARIRVRLNQLNADIEANGMTELFQQSERCEPYVRARPQADLFVKLDKNYQAIIRQLDAMLPEETGAKSKLGALIEAADL